MKTDKKIIKKALKHPEQYSTGELLYFQLIKKERKAQKKAAKVRETEDAA